MVNTLKAILVHFHHWWEKKNSRPCAIRMCVCVYKFVCILIDCRAIHDVKATDLGLGKVRFKAEVDFDGRVVTRSISCLYFSFLGKIAAYT